MLLVREVSRTRIGHRSALGEMLGLHAEVLQSVVTDSTSEQFRRVQRLLQSTAEYVRSDRREISTLSFDVQFHRTGRCRLRNSERREISCTILSVVKSAIHGRRLLTNRIAVRSPNTTIRIEIKEREHGRTNRTH